MSRSGDFWSRRRADVEAEAQALAVEAQVAAEAEAQARLDESRAQKSDAEILAELNLRDPDEMGAGDDFSAFMAKAVPERFRRRALRKLWLTNPVLANLDELLDYGEDYTDAALVVENMQTVYQVGKGMLAQFDEVADELASDAGSGAMSATSEAQAEAEIADDAADDEAIDVASANDVTDDVTTDEEAALAGATRPEAPPEREVLADPGEPEGPPAPPRRRMQFEFAG